ncbi:MAG: zf-TFIIB domain-containing protein [Myxococcaceae bacterium]
MSRVRDCPDCNTRMQPFWLPAKKPGLEVELDRCGDCGGVWFDGGELQEACGRTVTEAEAETDRICPECDVPLLEGQLAGGVEVETCGECDGTFLEARDLDALVKKQKKKAAAPGGTGFVCDECGERKPFSEAEATLTGLECNACVKKKKEEPAPEAKKKSASMFGSFLGWLRGE